jgi:hypothetical protein
MNGTIPPLLPASFGLVTDHIFKLTICVFRGVDNVKITLNAVSSNVCLCRKCFYVQGGSNMTGTDCV